VTSTLNLLINFALLLLIATALGYYPNWRWLLLPIPLLLMQTMGFGIGLILGTLNVFFRDVGEWTAIVLQLLMWTLPIVYVAGSAHVILRWHPLMPPVDAVHNLLMNGPMPDAFAWIAMFAWPTAIVIIATKVLHHLRPQIRDVI
jgi:lipopolysaccharide transport system permease protein